jgi:hypothetical protein
LRQVAGSADHRSACWLPVDEVGLSDEVDRKREQVALARRGALAAESSDVIADDDVPDGSATDVPAEEVAGTTGRAQPLTSASAVHEVRASTSPGRRTGQPAPPARPRAVAKAVEPAPQAAKTAAKKTAAKKTAATKTAATKTAAKKVPAKKSAAKPADTKGGSR